MQFLGDRAVCLLAVQSSGLSYALASGININSRGDDTLQYHLPSLLVYSASGKRLICTVINTTHPTFHNIFQNIVRAYSQSHCDSYFQVSHFPPLHHPLMVLSVPQPSKSHLNPREEYQLLCHIFHIASQEHQIIPQSSTDNISKKVLY